MSKGAEREWCDVVMDDGFGTDSLTNKPFTTLFSRYALLLRGVMSSS